MSDKIAVVTGGTRGIGLEISKALKEQGFTVVAVYYGNEEAAKSFREILGTNTIKFDVSDYAQCEEGIKKIESEYGPVAVLVNNAGITRDGVLHKMTPEAWSSVMDTNLNSCFNMCRSVINGMRERNFGRIINISSINGQKGQFGQTNYSAAKAGMIGFTKALAMESAAKGITVNVICPGYIATDMTSNMNQDVLDSIIRQIPVTRMGKPEEIASVVTYLTSENAGFITGSTITVNGGQYMI